MSLSVRTLLGLVVLLANMPAQAQGLDPAGVKQALRRWPGLAAFQRWHLLDVELEAAANGKCPARLVLGPPDAWSKRSLPYRLRLAVELSADSGLPAEQRPEWQALARDVKQLIQRAERHIDVRRFCERYELAEARIECQGRPAGLELSYVGKPEPGGSPLRAPALTYAKGVQGRIRFYRLLSIDGLPARPELLRFAEILSERHPGCRPVRIDARLLPTVEPGEVEVEGPVEPSWVFESELAGGGCPATFTLVVSDSSL
ncbi:MAG: hypothetical protein JXR96_28975 [Deltaproteobacteria bacterium]|nr:hypothetical protein [Deltaproteobacteria bacterium]